jgi:putative acetyltransferase
MLKCVSSWKIFEQVKWMSIVYRKLQKADNLLLANLIRTVFREFKVDRPGSVYTDPTTDNLFELFSSPGSVYWVAEDEGKLIGGCGIYPTDGLELGYAELVKFYLDESFRGKGIGKNLMEKSFQSAREMGYKFLYLESFPELSKAVGMYEKAGFTHLNGPMGNSGHYACNIWMIKKL